MTTYRRTKPRHSKVPVVKQPEPFCTTKDGREICDSTPAGRREYDNRKGRMWHRDKGICYLCFQYLTLEESTFDHRDGRGGGKHDDRIAKNGVAHYFGNMAKSSIRYDRYMLLPLEVRIQNCRGGY